MAQLFGVRVIEVDDVDFTPDLPAMLRAITPQTRLIFLASPNNPTGTRVTNAALDEFLRALPSHVIAVLDEAYHEFLDDAPDTVARVKAGERVVLMRTFSKIQGLAGLRIGYGLASARSPTCSSVRASRSTRIPSRRPAPSQAWEMSSTSRRPSRSPTKAVRCSRRPLRRWGSGTRPSSANFVLVHVGDGGEVFKRLMKKGIIVRSMVSYRLPAYIRVSVGTPEQNARFLAELPEALEGLVAFTKPQPAAILAPAAVAPQEAEGQPTDAKSFTITRAITAHSSSSALAETQPLKPVAPPGSRTGSRAPFLMSFGTVAILGPGLIGGSLALALAERGLAKRLTIYARSPRALDEIRIAGVDAELSTNPSEAVREADVVILCVPIEAMPALVNEFRDALKPNALVTDVGSVKGSVDAALAPLLKGKALWIGSHPMAGSEQSGFVAARADLFEKAAAIVTPTPESASGAEKKAADFWRALGSRVFTLSPAEHDQAVADISHMPHLVAALLVANAKTKSLPLAAGGFRDTTRVASASPGLWVEILEANREALAQQCGAWSAQLAQIERLFRDRSPAAKSELFKLLENAQSVRSQLYDKKLPPLS